MKKSILSLLAFLLFFNVFPQDGRKNLAGAGWGVIFPMTEGLYLGDPFDFWPNREISDVFQVFYQRILSPSFHTGGYFEYEHAEFDIDSETVNGVFQRYNLGINWLGKLPSSKAHIQLGGYFGYGWISANGWDPLNGIDLGMMAGPAYEMRHIGVAIHIQSGYAVYFGQGDPEEVILYNPKFLWKVYYKW